MGLEAACRLRIGKRALAGTAMLEGDRILFRGEERIRIELKEVRSVRASDGVLTLEREGGAARLELGAAAEKWAHKILHPPTLSEKLGIKAGVSVALVGEFDPAFVEGLPETPPGEADIVLLAAPDRLSLEPAAALARGLRPAASLWVVYPKGVTAIREGDVLASGRAAGLKDIKVVSFSATHTALKFVVPRASRPTSAKGAR